MGTLGAVVVVLAGLAQDGAGRASATCEMPAQGNGHVAAVIDARTLRLTDGRDIRLTGLARPAAPDAGATLSALTGDRDIVLRGADDSPDRYGRQGVFVFVEGSAQSVQATLLTRGAAVYSGLIGEPACAAELQAAEAKARASRTGIWAAPDAIKNAERTGDIVALAGQFAVVEGKVVSVRQAGTTFYVNFGRRWTEGFAVTISGRMIAALERAGIAPASLENRRLRVRGWVERHNGPRMEVFHPGQIELIGDRSER
jgi:endonuclease YncB( thermonuclease family)